MNINKTRIKTSTTYFDPYPVLSDLPNLSEKSISSEFTISSLNCLKALDGSNLVRSMSSLSLNKHIKKVRIYLLIWLYIIFNKFYQH